jgi:hypothetical protein
MTRMTSEQISERLLDKLVDVINDQRKKDAKTGRSLIDSNATVLFSVINLTANMMVSIIPREQMEKHLKLNDESLRDMISGMLKENTQ